MTLAVWALPSTSSFLDASLPVVRLANFCACASKLPMSLLYGPLIPLCIEAFYSFFLLIVNGISRLWNF